jgi:type IV pilus assembly protein PilC
LKYYKYKAKDEAGKTVSGTIQANDEFDLHERLKADNKYLVDSKEVNTNKSFKRLKANVISNFARNMGELIGSGVSLVKALRIISEDESINPKEREVYSNILKLVRSGISLSEAMQEQGDSFPPLFINMIKSAEAGGNMDRVALQMAAHYDKDYRLNQKVKSSMTYPKILVVMIVIVVAIIMGYVIPQFKDLFSQMDSLPMSTTILLAISNFVKNRWYVIVLVVVIAYIFLRVLFAIPAFKYHKDKMTLKLPVFGKLLKVIYTARFARTLSSLYSAGISIINCLQISKNTIGNAYIEQQFDKVIADVKSGENLSTAIDNVDGFTKKLSSTIMVGEETGSLEGMLVSCADQMEYDSELALNKMVAYIEPAMIVVMAVVVGFVIISVIQPIYGSYATISSSY